MHPCRFWLIYIVVYERNIHRQIVFCNLLCAQKYVQDLTSVCMYFHDKKNVCIMIWMLLEMFRFFVCLMVSQFLLLIIKLVHHARCTLYILEVPELQLYTGASCSLNVRVNFWWEKLIVHPHVIHIFSYFFIYKKHYFCCSENNSIFCKYIFHV